MANYAFNIAKGRIGEFAYRVKNGDPANSRLYAVAIKTDVAQGTAIDVDDFAAFVSAGGVEADNGSYAKKVLAAADIATVASDDTGDKYWVDLNDITWSAIAAGNAWVAIIICYASVLTPSNAQMIPLTHHDFAVTPDGSDIVAQVATAGMWSAS